MSTSKRLKIGIDVDDVLADFISKHRELCREMFGKPETDVIPCDWAMSNYGLTAEQMVAVWQRIHDTEDFWLTLRKKDGVDPCDLAMLDIEHDLYFITSRALCIGDSLTHQTAYWLKKNLWVPLPTVIVTSNKGPIAAALGLDYFIDDRPKNCVEVKDAVPTCKVFLKDAGHNQEFEDERIERVESFNEFAQIIQEETRPQSQGFVRCQESLAY